MTGETAQRTKCVCVCMWVCVCVCVCVCDCVCFCSILKIHPSLMSSLKLLTSLWDDEYLCSLHNKALDEPFTRSATVKKKKKQTIFCTTGGYDLSSVTISDFIQVYLTPCSFLYIKC